MQVRDALYLQYEPLAEQTVRRLWKRNQRVRQIGELADAVQCGRIALLEAIDKHPPGKDTEQFCRFVTGYIEKSLHHAIEDTALIRVPHDVAAEADAMTVGRLAESRYGADTLAAARVKFVSVDLTKIAERSEVESMAEYIKILPGILARIPEEDRKLLTYYYGLDGLKSNTVEELALHHGVSQRTMTRRIARAKKKLRTEFAKNGQPQNLV